MPLPYPTHLFNRQPRAVWRRPCFGNASKRSRFAVIVKPRRRHKFTSVKTATDPDHALANEKLKAVSFLVLRIFFLILMGPV